MAFLSTDQILEIKALIELFHYAFTANVIHKDYVPPEILEKLEQMGVLKPGKSIVEDTYLFGQLTTILEDKQPLSYDEQLSKIRYDKIKYELSACAGML